MKDLYHSLEERQLDFFEAMKLLAGYLFFRFCLDAKKEQRKVLLIEDGGYIAPYLNEYCLAGKSATEVFEIYSITDKNNESITSFLSDVLIGSVEHTRNGYDRLQTVQNKHGKLQFPAYSIALSTQKIVEESKEVARSILNAIESILNGQGMVLGARRLAVLGSEGNIGRYLCRYLDSRLENPELIRVDLVCDKDCYKTIGAISRKKLYDIDLFLGVIGESILTKDVLIDIILNSNKKNLIFASGSTKTLEFTHLLKWLGELAHEPIIAGEKVEVNFERIIDPQSRLDQGGRVKILTKNGEKVLFLLGDLSPINFLYYGVPTETMDAIISQLTTISIGLAGQFITGKNIPSVLYAVDHEIDTWGNHI